MFAIKHLSLISSKFFSFTGLFGLATGLIGIGFLIGFHELGHFLFAKLFKVRTPSFSIGFGPQLISKKIGDTQFSISALPLGGYVELAGAAEIGQGEQKEAGAVDSGSFKSKPFYQKFLILSGGILFNLLFTYIAFIGIFKIGMVPSAYLYPLYANTTIESVEKGSAAEQYGLAVGDSIVSIDGKPIDTALQLLEIIGANPGRSLDFQITRDNVNINKQVTLENKQLGTSSLGFLGITLRTPQIPSFSLLEAIRHGSSLATRIILSTLYSFKTMFINKDFSRLKSPFFLISETVRGASVGWQNLIIFLAIISVNLAVLNLIPLPILDGGQILFYAIEAVIGRSLPIKIREYIFIASWVALLSLVLYLTWKDILGFFTNVSAK